MNVGVGNNARPERASRDFVSRLYQACAGDHFSEELCALARQLTGVPYATIRVVGSQLLVIADVAAPEEVSRGYTRAVSLANPITELAGPKLLTDGYCRISDLLSLDEYRASEFYQTVVEPMGFLDEAAVLLHASPAGLVYLSIGERIAQGAIDDAAYGLLRDAAGDMKLAYAIHRRLHDVSQGAREWNRIEFDDNGRLLEQQGELAAYLFDCGALEDSDGILCSPQPQFTRPIHELLIANLLGLTITDTVLRTPVGDVGLQASERSDEGELRFVARIGFTGYIDESFDRFLHDRYELTDREREIAYLIAENHSLQAIGDRLFISVDTVRTHTKRVLKKSRCATQQHLSEFINRYRPRRRPGAQPSSD